MAFLAANDQAAQLLGYTHQELLRMTLFDVGSSDGVPAPFGSLPWQTSATDGSRLALIVRGYQRRDGTTIDVQMSSCLLPLEGRQVLLVCARDIAGRLQAERAARDSQRWFKALFDGAPDAFVIIDEQGHCVDANQATTTMLGYTRGELLRLDPTDIVRPGRLELSTEMCAQLCSDGQWYGEMELACKNGHRIMVECTVVADIQRGVHLAVLRDITRLREAEATLSSLSARLFKLRDEERRRIARELHDQTAQYITALSLNLAVLDGVDVSRDPRARQALTRCHEQLDQCANSIRTITYLLHPPLPDKGGLVPALRRYVQGFAERSRIAATFEVAPDFPRLDPDVATALFRIVQECLSNINRHSCSPTALVHLGSAAGHVTLKVADQGRGLPERSGDAPDEITGLGVGITGMRERVCQLAGELEILTSPRGTTVVAIIPLSPTR